jgi:hypothetical protein
LSWKESNLNTLFENYLDYIGKLDMLSERTNPIPALKLWEDDKKGLECFYAPFDHVNRSAKLIIIGITPGRTQMNRSLNAAAKALEEKKGTEDTLAMVKKHASLGGAMRSNIVRMLNKLGYAKKLGVECASEFWSSGFETVHFCSLLKYPVFIKGKDYNGTPYPLKVPELRALLMDEFVQDLQKISADAEVIALGDFVASVLDELDSMGLIKQKVLRFEGKVVAPPHPSGANAEAIALLLSDTYPTMDEYLERMYGAYLKKQGVAQQKPQAEEKYKAARRLRWERIRFVRGAYGID